MFQRQLLRSSRAASQAIKQTRTQHIQLSPYSSLSSRSLRTLQPTASQHFSRRWQSTETQTTSDKPAEGGEKPTEASPEDALKQEIEKKNKEIIELKVNQQNRSPTQQRILTQSAGQIPPQCSRLPQPSRPHHPRGHHCPPIRYSALRNRPSRKHRQPRPRSFLRP